MKRLLFTITIVALMSGLFSISSTHAQEGVFGRVTDGPLYQATVSLPISYGTNPMGSSGDYYDVTITVTAPDQIQEGVPFDLVIEFLPNGYNTQTGYDRWTMGATLLTLILDDDASLIAGVPRQELYVSEDVNRGEWIRITAPDNAVLECKSSSCGPSRRH